MKILQIIYESFGSPFGFGGAGVRAYEIYKRLGERHKITLLCMKYPGARDGEINGLKHIFLGMESNNLTASVLAYTLAASVYVARHGGKYDLIVENFLPTTPFFSRLLMKTPVILQVQGVMYEHSFRKFSPLYSIPIYIVERIYPYIYDTFIFVSEVTREKVLSERTKHLSCPVIPNGIEKSLLDTTTTDGDYILFFSRIDIYTKGLDLLIKAYEELCIRHSGLKLLLAGYEFDKWETLLENLSPDVTRGVEYRGFVSGVEKEKLLLGATFFVLPSRHESSPISIIEAAACGKAVVTADIRELSFVKQNEIGLTFESGNYGDLASAMETLLSDESLRLFLGENGREYARKFQWDNIALKFEEFIISQAGLPNKRL